MVMNGLEASKYTHKESTVRYLEVHFMLYHQKNYCIKNDSVFVLSFQAALGPVPLDEVRKLHLEQYEAYANTVLVIAVLSILITAPVGAILITVLGPRLLQKDKHEEAVTDCQMPGQHQINSSVESTVAA
jgi:hypothetical protein